MGSPSQHTRGRSMPGEGKQGRGRVGESRQRIRGGHKSFFLQPSAPPGPLRNAWGKGAEGLDGQGHLPHSRPARGGGGGCQRRKENIT